MLHPPRLPIATLALLTAASVAGLSVSGCARSTMATPVFTVLPTDYLEDPNPDHRFEVIGLGNLNPGSGHTLPINHMHIGFPHNEVQDGAARPPHPLFAPGAGTVVVVFQERKDESVHHDGSAVHDQWMVWIKVSDTLMYLVDHLDTLDPEVQGQLEALGYWTRLGAEEIPRALILERSDALGHFRPGLHVAAGRRLGTVRAIEDDAHHTKVFAWDIGVIDKSVHRTFVNPSRYPTFDQLAQANLHLGGFDYPFLGNPFLNAGAFPDYYADEVMRQVFLSRVASPDHYLGSDAWDFPGRLRGNWFNPALDAASPQPPFDFESAALAIVVDPLDANRWAVSIGNHSSDNPGFAPFDSPDAGVRVDLSGYFSGTPLADGAINPDPQRVAPGTTVAYELRGRDGIHTLLCRLLDDHQALFKLVPHPGASVSAAVADLAAANAAVPTGPGEGWQLYQR